MRTGRERLIAAIASTVCFLAARGLTAGMPAPLPTDVQTTQQLSRHAAERIQAISFFLAIVLVSAAVVMFLWNFVRRDFPSLPRLTYLRSLGAVLLWGLIFVVVLTMISGARELMTPGAWEKRGFTYRLADDDKTATNDNEVRLRKLELLRTELWKFAATHDGRFPSQAEADRIPSSLWCPGQDIELRYRYLPGQKAGGTPTALVIEPELQAGEQLVLMSDGVIVRMTPDEAANLVAGKSP